MVPSEVGRIPRRRGGVTRPVMKTLAVVIPSHNDAEMLERCLVALSRQTRPADEIIVVNNASTDATVDVARRFGATVVDEPRKGVTSATAAGFDAARADIIGRLDADSIPAEDWCERLVEIFDENPDLAAATANTDFYGGRRWMRWVGRNVYIGGYLWAADWALGHPPVFGSNCALSYETWQRIREAIPRDKIYIHDDLIISILIEPDMPIVVDDRLRVTVSARPFKSARGIARRVWWAYKTVRVQWDEESLITRRRRHRAGKAR